MQTNLLPPNFWGFSYVNGSTKLLQFTASPINSELCTQETGFAEAYIWLETFAFGQIPIKVTDVTVS